MSSKNDDLNILDCCSTRDKKVKDLAEDLLVTRHILMRLKKEKEYLQIV